MPLIRASRAFSRREKALDENDVAPTPPPRSLSLRERVAPSATLRGCEEIQSGPRCGRDEASREARRRGDAGTSRRRRNEADGLVPPATLRAGGGCGAI